MSQRALKLLDQLTPDLTLSELRELEGRLQVLAERLTRLDAQQRQDSHAQALQEKYPGLRTLLESGRAHLGKPKPGPLYGPTGVHLPNGLTSKDLLDWDRGER